MKQTNQPLNRSHVSFLYIFHLLQYQAQQKATKVGLKGIKGKCWWLILHSRACTNRTYCDAATDVYKNRTLFLIVWPLRLLLLHLQLLRLPQSSQSFHHYHSISSSSSSSFYCPTELSFGCHDVQFFPFVWLTKGISGSHSDSRGKQCLFLFACATDRSSFPPSRCKSSFVFSPGKVTPGLSRYVA